MKLGRFAAFCCFGIAQLSAGLSCRDMQAGYFSTKRLFVPICTGLLGVALLLFPGGSTTLQQAAQPGSTHTFDECPPQPRRVWLLTAGLASYLALWAQSWLAGEAFFTGFQQLGLVFSFGAMWLFLRKQLRQLW